MPPRISVFGVVVTDMPAALAFYRRLGLDFPPDADDQPHVDIELPGGLRLTLDTVETIRSFDPDWQPATGGPATSLAFACDDPADVDRTYQALIDAGYEGHLAPWDAFWGMRYATVHDPDGNGVDLFALLPSATTG